MDNKTLRKKLIICCLLLIIILGLCVYIISSQIEKKRLQEEEIRRQEIINENIEKYLSDKICPKKMSTLYTKYKGENSKDDLYRSLSGFINYLPDICSDVTEFDDIKILEYYQKNVSIINQILGITNENEFVTFAKYIQNINLTQKTYSYCEIDSTTYKIDGDYLTFNLDIFYEELENPITVKVHFANRTSVTPEVMYSIPN